MDKIVCKTKHGEITIDELAQLQPGLGKLMDDMSTRFTYMYHSAKGGNWKLAHYQYRSFISIMKKIKIVRPKYTTDMDAYEKHFMIPVKEAIEAEDWKKFEETYKKSVEGSDHYHDKYDFSYIRFITPKNPPEHMDLGPPEKFSRKKKPL